MIRWGAVVGKAIGVPLLSSATVGVGFACEPVDVAVFCPQAVNRRQNDKKSKIESRKVSKRESIEL